MTKMLVSHTMVFVLALRYAVALPAAGTEFTPILPLDPPTIVGSSEAVTGGVWDVTHLIDGQMQTEYASAGKGVETYVDFDFGRPVALAGFQHIDRNAIATAHSARLIFSGQPDFGSPLGALDVKHVDQRSGVTMVTFPPVTARYVRWQVTGINALQSGCIGGKEISFFTTAARDALPSRNLVSIQPEQIVLQRDGQHVQVVAITVDHHYAEPVKASLEVDGLAPIPLELSLGKATHEVTLPLVASSRSAGTCQTRYLVEWDISPLMSSDCGKALWLRIRQLRKLEAGF